MEPVCMREWILNWNTYLGCPKQVLLFVVALHENESETYSRVSDKKYCLSKHYEAILTEYKLDDEWS